jgi:hypothetical protein
MTVQTKRAGEGFSRWRRDSIARQFSGSDGSNSHWPAAPPNLDTSTLCLSFTFQRSNRRPPFNPTSLASTGSSRILLSHVRPEYARTPARFLEKIEAEIDLFLYKTP